VILYVCMCNHRRYSRPCRCTCSCRQCSRTWHACRTYDYYSRTRSVRRSWTCRFYSNREDTRTYKSRSRWRTSCSRCSGDRPIHLAACTHPHLMMIRKEDNIDWMNESSYELTRSIALKRDLWKDIENTIKRNMALAIVNSRGNVILLL